MLLASFSFQGNKKVYLECTNVRREEGGEKSVNDAEGAITISQSQIVKIKTPHLLMDECERMFRNNNAAHSAPFLILASFIL